MEEEDTRIKRSTTETKRNVDESAKKVQQVGSMSDKCQEMTQAQKDVLIPNPPQEKYPHLLQLDLPSGKGQHKARAEVRSNSSLVDAL